MNSIDVAVVGGGLAGLACASQLVEAGRAVRLFEASDRVGGRIRTDRVDGFLLDRGFQVFLDAYPSGRKLLDLEALDLRAFSPGAVIMTRDGPHRVMDPWRNPGSALKGLASPVGSMADKLKIASLRTGLIGKDPLEVLEGPDHSTLVELRERGFTEQFIGEFFKPFYGGVFLDPGLETSSRLFRFTFQMFSRGRACVPAGGMERIPAQLAARLPGEVVQVDCPVAGVSGGGVTLASGVEVGADHVVLAAGPGSSARLGGMKLPETRGATCYYYSTSSPPLEDPLLVLNGTGEGPVNNLAVMSRVSPDYAPEGRDLVAVVALDGGAGGDALEGAVRAQCRAWYPEVKTWEPIAAYPIPDALPAQPPGVLSPPSRTARREDGLILAGDHMETASIEGALRSGLEAASLVLGF